MPRKGRSNEEIIHALHQVERGDLAVSGRRYRSVPLCTGMSLAARRRLRR